MKYKIMMVIEIKGSLFVIAFKNILNIFRRTYIAVDVEQSISFWNNYSLKFRLKLIGLQMSDTLTQA
jgi:hypothetical protein